MNELLIEKLIAYIDALGSRISVYRSAPNGIPTHILQRLSEYSEIVEKQKSLAQDLRRYMEEKNWYEVCRHVQLIKGLSTMVREDAQALFTDPSRVTLETEEKELLS